MFSCDVLIVGGGASGSVAALRCAKAGLKVVLLERQHVIGGHSSVKIDVTETSGLKDIITELGLEFLGSSSQSVWYSSNNSFELNSRVSDLFVLRGNHADAFERSTVKKAQAAGCNVFLGASIDRVEVLDKNVFEVGFQHDGAKHVVKPKIVIAADGVNSIFSEKLGISKGFSLVKAFDAFGFVGKGFKMAKPGTHVFFDVQILPGGYFYIASDKNGFGVACAVVDPKLSKKAVKESFIDFIRKDVRLVRLLPDNKMKKSFFNGSSMAGIALKRASGNVLFVGDAGRTLDPLFGYGVNQAIVSGYVGANAAIRAVQRGTHVGVGDEYEILLERRLGTSFNEALKAKKLFHSLSNDEIDDIVSAVKHFSKKGKNIDDVLDSPQDHLLDLSTYFAGNPRKAMLLLKGVRTYLDI